MGKDRRTLCHYTVPSFDLRGGSCGVTIWGGCVDDDAAVVVAAAGAAVEDWLLLLLFDDLVVAVVPELDPGAGSCGVEGLAPFRAVGVFDLPPPLEEASRWSSALSASALQWDPTQNPATPIRQLQAQRKGEQKTV